MSPEDEYIVPPLRNSGDRGKGGISRDLIKCVASQIPELLQKLNLTGLELKMLLFLKGNKNSASIVHIHEKFPTTTHVLMGTLTTLEEKGLITILEENAGGEDGKIYDFRKITGAKLTQKGEALLSGK